MEYKKVQQEINDIVGDNVKRLGELFPSVIKDGEVDFNALKEQLGQFIEVGTEKYELTWAGKQEAKRLAQEDVINKTLKFIPEDSRCTNSTQNIYIEGDNLEVLKLIRQNYYSSIKMIYIDPPYNTGNDFVYNDCFTMKQSESDMAENIINEYGERYTINSKSQNRYHAKWLSMIYPRLKVAKDLLTNDGIIFISIDDNEQENLKKCCDEILGADNFIAELVWDLGTGTTAGHFTRGHEYILCYAKNKKELPNFKNNINDEKIIHGALKKISKKNPAVEITFPVGFEYEGTNAVFKGEIGDSEKEYILSDEMRFENGKLVKPTTIKAGFAMKNQVVDFIEGKEVLDTKGQRVNRFYFNKNGILFYEKEKSIINPRTVLSNIGSTKNGTKDLESLFKEKYFDFPKPVVLLKYLIQLVTDENSIILDFFSGSASLAEAVMQLNLEDSGKRKYIMVQYPELCEENSAAFKAGYKNICEVGKERIRRSGDKIRNEYSDTNIDMGFKVFKVANTNIKWNTHMDSGQIDVSQIELSPDSVDFMPGTNDIDVVYELILRQRDLTLSDKIEKLTDLGTRVYLYASSYLVCLETEITVDLVDKLASIDPLPIKFIFRDSAFKDDIALKDETFRRLKTLIEKNSGNTKQSYTVEFI